MDDTSRLTILGEQTPGARKQIECFKAPDRPPKVTFSTPEFTSLCPKTGQPDFATITIVYLPAQLCIESKSLKLFLWTFREEGAFIESLARQICDELFDACRPMWMRVVISAFPRGGIALEADAGRERGE